MNPIKIYMNEIWAEVYRIKYDSKIEFCTIGLNLNSYLNTYSGMLRELNKVYVDE